MERFTKIGTGLDKQEIIRREKIQLQDPIEYSEERGFDILLSSLISSAPSLSFVLIKREFRVPRKHKINTNVIDFLFIGNDGLLTFVECKRKDDPRDVRDWIGQIIGYLSDSFYYLGVEDLEKQFYSRFTNDQAQKGLACLSNAKIDMEVSDFFSKAIRNLENKTARFILVTDTASEEIKSYIGFLNTLMPSLETAIIEFHNTEECHDDENHIPTPLIAQVYNDSNISRTSLIMDSYSNKGTKSATRQAGAISSEDFETNAKRSLGSAERVQLLIQFIDELIDSGFALNGYERGENGSKVWFKYFKILEDGSITFIEDRLGTDTKTRERLRKFVSQYGGIVNKDDRKSKFPKILMNQWERLPKNVIDGLTDIFQNG